MNTYHTFILFAFILLFSNASLARRIYPHPDEQHQENVPVEKMMMLIPPDSDLTGLQYVLTPLYQGPDRK